MRYPCLRGAYELRADVLLGHVDVVVGAELAGVLLLLGAVGDCHGAEAHVMRKLHAQVAQTADSLTVYERKDRARVSMTHRDGDEVAGTSGGAAEAVVDRQTGALQAVREQSDIPHKPHHERCRLLVSKALGNDRCAIPRHGEVLSVATVDVEARHLQLLANDLRAAVAAGGAVVAGAAKPANTDTLTLRNASGRIGYAFWEQYDLACIYTGTNSVNVADYFVSWCARELVHDH